MEDAPPESPQQPCPAAPDWSLDWVVDCGGLLVVRGTLLPAAGEDFHGLTLELGGARHHCQRLCATSPAGAPPPGLAFATVLVHRPQSGRIGATLYCEGPDGRRQALPSRHCTVQPLQRGERRGGRDHPLQQGVRRALSLLRSGGPRVLANKLRRYGRALQPRLPALRTLQATVAGSRDVHLFIDHGLGGGAGGICDQRVADAVARGGAALRIQSDPLGRCYRVSFQCGDRTVRGPCRSLAWLEDLPGGTVRAAELHTAAHFLEPGLLFAMLLRLQLQQAVPLRIHLHDYFLVCPSHFLLADSGTFCGIPALRDCERCLPANANVVHGAYRRLQPAAWRQLCGLLLRSAAAITVYSRSSEALLRRAYPELGPVECEPPTLPSLPPPLPRPGDTTRLHIGVIGEVGRHKGSDVVAALAAHLEAHHPDERITVIGTIEASCRGRVLRQTGPYAPGSLAAQLARAGVNVILFPSIVPETFSFTIREATATGLPVACFSLGAQAEWLASYRAGALLKSMEPASVYRELGELLKRSYPPLLARSTASGGS